MRLGVIIAPAWKIDGVVFFPERSAGDEGQAGGVERARAREREREKRWAYFWLVKLMRAKSLINFLAQAMPEPDVETTFRLWRTRLTRRGDNLSPLADALIILLLGISPKVSLAESELAGRKWASSLSAKIEPAINPKCQIGSRSVIRGKPERSAFVFPIAGSNTSSACFAFLSFNIIIFMYIYINSATCEIRDW